MISLPKLDDQNYAEIVEAAKRRIPVIFPEWTDFNEHDPGITVIELFAWLKEMRSTLSTAFRTAPARRCSGWREFSRLKRLPRLWS